MNWGKSIALAMAVFVLFIVGLGVYMASNSDSLFEKDYYEKGENHTAVMNAEAVGKDVTVKYANGNLIVELPKPGTVQTVVIKNMANANLDQKLSNVENQTKTKFTIRLDSISTGQWYASVSGQMDSKAYIKKVKWMVD